MEIGGRVNMAGVCGCYATFNGNDQLGRNYHTYLATIIQLYMMDIKQICCKKIITKLHRVLTS